MSPRMNAAGDAALDVVIVNWNSGDDLSRCLASLAAPAAARHIRQIVVVDNGSTDDSLDRPFPALPISVDRRATIPDDVARARRQQALQDVVDFALERAADRQ